MRECGQFDCRLTDFPQLHPCSLWVSAELQEEMRTQYAIGYTPTNEVRDGSYRKLDVKMVNKDLKAQARKGYYATRLDQ